jgi:hypothetical protein
MPPDDDLDGWIRDLRIRLARGDLATLLPIDIGDGTGALSAEQTIRVMVADLRDLDDPMGSWGGDIAWREERRSGLLLDFRRLRELLG